MRLLKKYPRYKLILAIWDFTGLVLSLIASILVTRQSSNFAFADPLEIRNVTAMFLLFSLLVIFYFQFANLYKIQVVLNFSKHVFTLVKTIFFSVLGFLIFLFFLRKGFVESRLFFGLLMIFALVIVTALRLTFASILSKSYAMKDRIVIIGAGGKGKKLLNIFKDKIPVVEPIGFLDDNIPVGSTVDGLKVLGRIDDFKEIKEKYKVHFFILAIDSLPRERFFEIFTLFQSKGIHFSVSSKYLQVLYQTLDIDVFDEFGMVRFGVNENTKLLGYTKRIFDFVFASFGLLLFSPVFIVLAFIIKFTSKGPVFYKQVRIGKNGQPFFFYKFRSMYINSDKDKNREKNVHLFIKGEEIGEHDTGKAVNKKIVNEKLITPVGAFIRKYSLDELPQLINVLKGEMSLVGPRPCIESEWHVYEDWQKMRLNAMPGCTGIWQVCGRSKVNFEESVLMDLYYIQNASISMDLQIILKTIPVMIFAKGGQ